MRMYLLEFLSNLPVEVMHSNKSYLTVRPQGVSKANMVSRILTLLEEPSGGASGERGTGSGGSAGPGAGFSLAGGGGVDGPSQLEFALIMGDDRSDEEMFSMFNPSSDSGGDSNERGGGQGGDDSIMAEAHQTFCVTVGKKFSTAGFYVEDVSQVVELIDSLGYAPSMLD